MAVPLPAARPLSSSLPLILLSLVISGAHGHLQVGFYSRKCPDAEAIVAATVREAAGHDRTLAAALLRLHFHDCFVHGCDGSILVEKRDGTAERDAVSHQGLRGFEVVERAKAKLESRCPGVVSCSDVVALAARDSIALSNGPHYQVPTGRRDGRVSNKLDAAHMPDVKDSVQVLRNKFLHRGLSERDLVVLSAAHTIGTTACFFIYDRLYGAGGPDPTINPHLLPKLLSTCPEGGFNGVRLALDQGSEAAFDEHILANMRRGFAVLKSDARLADSPSTRAIIDSYLSPGAGLRRRSFEADFVDAIVRMGMIGVKVGGEGEVRRVCTKFN